ncbi:hypothetical protein [Lysobacter gummosus]|uniref:hypothetical protein n=1 Tax=Lysobacter gummosus TaxID=262324 RepID=UPI00363A0F8D
MGDLGGERRSDSRHCLSWRAPGTLSPDSVTPRRRCPPARFPALPSSPARRRPRRAPAPAPGSKFPCSPRVCSGATGRRWRSGSSPSGCPTTC